jgi:hypothetical protein
LSLAPYSCVGCSPTLVISRSTASLTPNWVTSDSAAELDERRGIVAWVFGAGATAGLVGEPTYEA